MNLSIGDLCIATTAKTQARKSAAHKCRPALKSGGPDAIALLTADHGEFDEYFEAFEAASKNVQNKTIADKICLALKGHTQIEEEILYPPGRDKTNDGDLVEEAVGKHQGANIIAPNIYGVTTASGDRLAADHKIDGSPSVLFDDVTILPSDAGGAKLALEAAAVDFVHKALGHLKVIAYRPAGAPLFVKDRINDTAPDTDAGLIAFPSASIDDFLAAASAARSWAREPMVRSTQEAIIPSAPRA